MSETPITDIFRTVVPIIMFGAGLWAGMMIKRGNKNAKARPEAEGNAEASGEKTGSE